MRKLFIGLIRRTALSIHSTSSMLVGKLFKVFGLFLNTGVCNLGQIVFRCTYVQIASHKSGCFFYRKLVVLRVHNQSERLSDPGIANPCCTCNRLNRTLRSFLKFLVSGITISLTLTFLHYTVLNVTCIYSLLVTNITYRPKIYQGICIKSYWMIFALLMSCHSPPHRHTHQQSRSEETDNLSMLAEITLCCSLKF
jgi:hypothetical protein